jgi:hypothetical protein
MVSAVCQWLEDVWRLSKEGNHCLARATVRLLTRSLYFRAKRSIKMKNAYVPPSMMIHQMIVGISPESHANTDHGRNAESSSDEVGVPCLAFQGE